MIEVLFEDKDLIVLNKPCGLSMDRKPEESFDCVASLILDHYKNSGQKAKNLISGIVHRLDRPVSGLIVMAKKKSSLVKLNRSIEEHSFSKYYLAVCKGESNFRKETLTHYHIKNHKKFKAEIYSEKIPLSKEVNITLDTISNNGGFTLIKIKLNTGRYHQIRAQLAAVGLPIWNDHLYGAVKENEDSRIGLCAYNISFVHPIINEDMEFTQQPPDLIPWKNFDFSNMNLI